MDPLSTPGPEINYLDWFFIVELHFWSIKLHYVLSPPLVKDRPPSWIDDNIAVCAIISQAFSAANIKHIRKPGRDVDAAAMWRALKTAHEDHSSGGHIHWLYKLILMRMSTEDDIESHIEKMHKAYERLSALITRDNPLTADNIFATALVISLPPDWMSSILHLMQYQTTTSETIISPC